MLPIAIALAQHDNFALLLLKSIMSKWNLRYLPSVPFLSHIVNIFKRAKSSCPEILLSPSGAPT